MPQIGTQYPGLGQIFGDHSVMPAYFGTQQFMEAQDNNKINQDQALQDMLFKAQDQPLDLERKRGEISQQAALLPGYQADSELKQRNVAVKRGIPIEDEISQAAKHLAGDIRAEDLRAIEQEAQQALYSNDPQEQARGKHLSLLSQAVVREQEKMRLQEERDRQKLGMQGENARELMQMQIDAGRFKKSERAGKSEQELVSKLGLEKSAVFYKHTADEALADALPMEPGPERTALLAKATEYQRRADEALQAFERSKTLAGQQSGAGKVDVGSLAGVPTRPGATPSGFGGNNPLAASPTPSPVTDPARKAAAQDEATFKQAFGSYEPNKFDYRIGPNGVPQRKPK